MDYPKREIRESLNEGLLDYLSGHDVQREATRIRLHDLLQAADFAGIERLCHAFFAGIRFEWHSRNEIVPCECYYASVFYWSFAGLGLDVRVRTAAVGGGLARPGLHRAA